MEYRNLKYIVIDNKSFINFVKKHNFKINIDDTILLVSDCIILEIYGFHSEDTLYYDIYIENCKVYTNVNRLYDEEKFAKELLEIREHVRNQHQKSLLISSNLNELALLSALNAEQYFFIYTEIMDKLLNDFFSCNFDGYEQYFTDSFDISKKVLNRKLKELQFIDIDSIKNYTKIK